MCLTAHCLKLRRWSDLSKDVTKNEQDKPITNALVHLLKVESAVKQMIKLGEIDKELFEKYYEEVEG